MLQRGLSVIVSGHGAEQHCVSIEFFFGRRE
jgi:hypothetical protein